MKRILAIIPFLLLLKVLANAQSLPLPEPSLVEGWERLYVKGLGSIDIPPTMEVQSDRFKKMKNELLGRMEYQEAQLIAQQKGLNEAYSPGPQKYVRVMLWTYSGTPGEFDNLNYNYSVLSQTEIAKLNEDSKKELIESFIRTQQTLVEWYPAKFEKINGMSCFHLSYKRRLSDQPEVIVNIYRFMNYDRRHEVTLSYRVCESDLWKSDLAIILKSLRITPAN